MKNTAESVGNDLGLVCPKCKSGEGIQIEIPLWIKLTPYGVEDTEGDRCWEDDSKAVCETVGCEWMGTANDLEEIELEPGEEEDQSQDQSLCTCEARSWYGDEHDTACQLTGATGATGATTVIRARILDLGCGAGTDLSRWLGHDQYLAADIWGIDCNSSRFTKGRRQYPERKFWIASGEQIPFPDDHFDQIIANVSLPYMRIDKVLGEVARTLKPGGRLRASLHDWRFTWREMWGNAFPRPLQMVYRAYVVVNGLWFDRTGKVFRCPGNNRRVESFQTVRGVGIALKKAGLVGGVAGSGWSGSGSGSGLGNEFRIEAIKL